MGAYKSVGMIVRFIGSLNKLNGLDYKYGAHKGKKRGPLCANDLIYTLSHTSFMHHIRK